MRSCLGVVIFVALVFPFAVGGLCMLAANAWVFDKEFYKEAVDNEALYEGLLQGMPDYINADAFDREFTTEQEAAVNTAYALALREVITADYLREETLSVIDEVFAVFDGTGDLVEVDIDLRPVKASLSDEGRNDFARVMAENLPPCEPGQEPRGSDDALISCTSSNMSQEDAEEQILRSLPAFVEEIPDTLVLNEPVDADAIEFGLGSARDALRTAIFSTLFFTMMFWLAAAWVGGESRRQRFLWLGIMLLIPAAMIFLTGTSLAGEWLDAASAAAETEITINGVLAEGPFVDAVQETFSTVFNRIGSSMQLVGGVALALAFALLGIAMISPSDTEDPPMVVIG